MGDGNTATGVNALYHNTTGIYNSASGFGALRNNTGGSSNIAVGYQAGISLTTGGNNIEIGSAGLAGESNVIRLGTQGVQTKTVIAGISTAMVSGAAVVVSAGGQLGVVLSSARYKRDIHDMNAASSKLLNLRPVTFRYKQDPEGERQYGLIAEEVARVYPELVTYGADGQMVTVRYHELVPMLLNEIKKQARENRRQTDQIRRLSAQITDEKATRKHEI
jgi:hypothetical protein